MEYLGLRYRAYPTPAQQQLLSRHAGACRAVWNTALEQRQAALDSWQRRGRPRQGFIWPSYTRQCAELLELRADPQIAPWLAETPSQILQQTLRNLDRAWSEWISGEKRMPRFKRRTGEQSFRDPQNVWVKRSSKRMGVVKIQGVGQIPVRLHRPLSGVIKHATVIREADGKWFVSLTVRRRTHLKPESTLAPVGIDLGVIVPVATSEGELLGEGFRTLTSKEAERLRRLERQLARRMSGSQNKQKTQLRINRLKARQRRRRTNFVEQVSSELAKSHGLIVFENLSARNMTKSAKGSVDEPGTNVHQKAGLNRSILDRSWGMIQTRTEQKAARYGSSVGYVPAAYSSQECPTCHVIDAASRVSQSRFVCTACGHTGHADVKAAITILERALAGGLVLSIAGGTPVTASSDNNPRRQTRKRRAAETRGSAGRGSRNKERVHGRSLLRNHAEASPFRAR